MNVREQIEPTEDPHVVIIERAPGRVRYRHANGEEWTVLGECNRCGLCEIGTAARRLIWSHPPGIPYACLDLDYPARRDIPMRPPFLVGCCLREG